jgi:hypothetical protein
LIVGAGWEEGYAQEVGNPYISAARAHMTRKALDAKADVIIYLDYDLSWRPQDLLTLLETPGDVVCGTYRYKKDEEDYMGCVENNAAGAAMGRADGCLSAVNAPAGFLKVTKEAIGEFMRAYPELVYGERYNPSVDLFNHGAYENVWYGEDYAFCRRWKAMGQPIWMIPDLDIDHHSKDKAFKGNLHRYLLNYNKGK